MMVEFYQAILANRMPALKAIPARGLSGVPVTKSGNSHDQLCKAEILTESSASRKVINLSPKWYERAARKGNRGKQVCSCGRGIRATAGFDTTFYET
jgi:hypothetical protein